MKRECYFLPMGENCMYFDKEECLAKSGVRDECKKRAKERTVYQLDMQIDFTPTDENDLTILQYLITDTAKAILENYGKVSRIGRGWKKLPIS